MAQGVGEVEGAGGGQDVVKVGEVGEVGGRGEANDVHFLARRPGCP